MNIYLAGASAELETCEYWMAQLRGQGHIITHDWTVSVRANRYLQISDWALSPESMADHAVADLTGVRDADIFWLLAPSTASTGAWVEFGYALSVSRLSGRFSFRHVVSGPPHRRHSQEQYAVRSARYRSKKPRQPCDSTTTIGEILRRRWGRYGERSHDRTEAERVRVTSC